MDDKRLDQLLDGPFYRTNMTRLPIEGEIINGYILLSKVRETNCSVVYIGSKTDDDNNEGKKALKFIKRRRGRTWQIKNEIYILTNFRNPLVLNLEDFFPHKEYVCLVTPYAPYQSIQAIINVDYPNGIPENIACIMMGKMLEAVQFLHSNNIWHRDIKPDNFLVYNRELHCLNIVICDFGYAKQYAENEVDTKYLGTPEFLPPEIAEKQSYNKSVDIWSLGISLFKMLSNEFPNDSSSGQIYPLNYEILIEKGISDEAIELIRKMCQENPQDRITVEEALIHPWILGEKKLIPSETQITRYIYQADNINENDNSQ